MELDFHAAILVGPDLLAGLADDDRGLRSGNRRLRRYAWWTKGNIGRKSSKRVGVSLLCRRMRDRLQDVVFVYIGAVVIFQLKLVVRDKRPHKTIAADNLLRLFEGVETQIRTLRPGVFLNITAGILVDLVSRRIALRVSLEIRVGC